jgi:hypothetical protein
MYADQVELQNSVGLGRRLGSMGSRCGGLDVVVVGGGGVPGFLRCHYKEAAWPSGLSPNRPPCQRPLR